jgi:LuxR family maltose regulon positive regulatory protein
MELQLAETAIRRLEDRTKRWIAGLQLNALTPRGREGGAELPQLSTGVDRYVVDYFVEEILHQQVTDIEAFLL